MELVQSWPTLVLPYSGACLLEFDPTIVQLDEGGPVRLRAPRIGRKPSGVYFSIKAGGHQPWESSCELKAMWLAEIDSDCVSFVVQPHTLQFSHNGQRLRYTPDRLDLLACGRKQAVEIKARRADVDADYLSRLACVKGIYHSAGVGFELIYIDEDVSPRQIAAAKNIQRYRRSVLTPRDLEIVHQHFSSTTSRPLSFVEEMLGGGARGVAANCALHVRRYLKVALDGELGPQTPVTIISYDVA